MKNQTIHHARATARRAIPQQTAFRTVLGILMLSAVWTVVLGPRLTQAASFNSGDVFASVNNGMVQHYDGLGHLVETLDTGLGGITAGCTLDATGNLYVTNSTANSVTKFAGHMDPHTPSVFVTSVAGPTGIAFDGTGNAYISNAATGGIIKVDGGGNTLLTLNTGGRADGIDVNIGATQILFTEGLVPGVQILNVASDTRQLPLNTTVGTSALRILPSGGVLVANNTDIKRLDGAGNVVQTYDVPNVDGWFAMNLDPDGLSFWSASTANDNFYKFNIAAGIMSAGPFNTGSIGGNLGGLCVLREITVGRESLCHDGVDNDNDGKTDCADSDCFLDPTCVICGNGIVNTGEECDDGNLVDGDGCDSNCTLTRCGNGIVTAGEQCDDGNLLAGDCCSPICQFESDTTACEKDGNLCTADHCDGAGKCVVGPNLVCADDGNSCNGPESCNPTTGLCVSGPPVTCADDGNVCNGPETCNPLTGQCASGPAAPATAPCEADHNVCTSEQCDGAGSCVSVGNLPTGADCHDSVFCNGVETCDGNGHCLSPGDPCSSGACHACHENTRTCFDQPGTLCDDANALTLDDMCDAVGVCKGRSVTGNYAVLGSVPQETVITQLGRGAQTRGQVCADRITAFRSSVIDGDAVAARRTAVAMAFVPKSSVTGNLITGGGAIRGLQNVLYHGNPPDTGGLAPELGVCAGAVANANARRTQFKALPVTSGFILGSIFVPKASARRIPAAGTLGPGQIVMDASYLHVGRHSTLTLVGDPSTTEVIVRVSGKMLLERDASINLVGLIPEQVLFIVDGNVVAQRKSHIVGTVVGSVLIQVGWGSVTDGALIGNGSMQVLQSSIVNLHPFVGW